MYMSQQLKALSEVQRSSPPSKALLATSAMN